MENLFKDLQFICDQVGLHRKLSLLTGEFERIICVFMLCTTVDCTLYLVDQVQPNIHESNNSDTWFLPSGDVWSISAFL